MVPGGLGRTVALSLALALAAAAPGRAASPLSFRGPPLKEPRAALERALECSGGVRGASRDPVLLVHGTFSNASESWAWGYRRVLPQQGFATCTVTYPDRGLGDIQRSAEYIVYAIHQVSHLSGRRIAVVGHSQGTIEPLWAIRFWPDSRARVSDYVGLAGPFKGTTASGLGPRGCDVDGRCWPAAHQMLPGSRLLAALLRGRLPGGPAYTSVASAYDQAVTPAPQASRLEGARNVVIQDICPGRPIDHVSMLADAVTYAVVLDAITHSGPADPARVPGSVCSQGYMQGADPVAGATLAPMFTANAFAAGATYPRAEREPRLRCYADPGCPLRGDEPAVSPDGRTIAFSRKVAGNRDVYLADADGSPVRRLTRSRAPDFQPAFSQDGRRLAFTRAGAVHTVAFARGARLRRLVRGSDPAFAPSGAIVFVRRGDLYRVDEDGNGLRPLTRGPARDGQPAVSRRGLLAFARTRRGNTDVYTLSAHSARPRRLTKTRLHESLPTFSRSGRLIAFTRRGRRGRALYVIRARGRQPRRAGGSQAAGFTVADEVHPAFFPDGSLLFARGGPGTRELWRLWADGPWSPLGT